MSGCTPLGGWLYDDPSFALSEVSLPGRTPADTAIGLTITGCNRNDFTIQGSALSLNLVLAGDSIASGTYNSQFTLAMRDSTRLAVQIPPSRRMPDSTGQRPSFTLTGQAIVYTPIGTRTVRLDQRGKMTRRKDSVLVAEQVPSCRPGQSTLPPMESVPIIIEQPAPTGSPMPGGPGPR